MKTAPICEIFTSLQGEGLYVGQKHLFIRFYGCSLRCNYCDTVYARTVGDSCTIKDIDKVVGNPLSTQYCADIVDKLWRPSTAMLSLTGGEPLLYPDFILELSHLCNRPMSLETNGAHPEGARKVGEVVDVVACDLKLPEHDAHPDYKTLFELEVESIGVFLENGAEVFLKVAVPERCESVVGVVSRAYSMIEKLKTELPPLVLQPIDGNGWDKLLTIMDEIADKVSVEVRVLPQLHKLMGLP